MLDIWLTASGTTLGTAQERTAVNLLLPVTTVNGITFSLIAGTLPPGLRLEGNRILGTPFEVSRPTVSTFVIRASDGVNISDRTFNLRVEGYDEPQWLTPEGALKVNPNNRSLFVLDGSYVDFQLDAIDDDLRAGEVLEFFIEEGDGSLPVGLSLTEDGKIFGFVDPILALDVSAGPGFYDTKFFDTDFFDPGYRAQNGMDTFLFDGVTYDYFDTIGRPKKLNRTFDFLVSVSDGETTIKRPFRIYVVGDDFLRADNAIMQVGTGLYTADTTYFRGVVWLTPRNLGVRRANNYVTVFLDTFDPNPSAGPVSYQLRLQNDDLSPSVLPPGVLLDSTNGELFGYVPYQPAVSKDYKFTINAIKYDRDSASELSINISMFESAIAGQSFIKIFPLLNESEIFELVGDTLKIGVFYYRVLAYESPDDTQAVYAILRFDRSLSLPIPGRTPENQPTVITKTYFDSASLNTTVSSKTFIISVLGEVDSAIRFTTSRNLGILRANLPSTLNIQAITTVPEAIVSYKLISGILPPGIELAISGELVGKVRQFGNVDTPGLTVFDTDGTSFDGRTTTFDRSYTFTILASDQYRYSAIQGEFTVSVVDPDKRLYSNIVVKPFQKTEKRQEFYNFISDQSIFVPSKIYRPSDTQFGVQKELKMLVYAGIETTEISNYMTALKTNHKRRRFRLGNIKKAIARRQGSRETLYEVVYLEVIDNLENGNKTSVSPSIKLPLSSKSSVNINQTAVEVYDGHPLVNTEISKFGGGSAYFETGTNSALKVVNGLRDFSGTGDFTFEGWFRFTNINKTQALFDLRGNDTLANSISLYLKDGKLQLLQGGIYKEFTPNNEFLNIFGTTDSLSGVGARFDISRSQSNYNVEIADGGDGYAVGDNIQISGDVLDGFAPFNDIILNVLQVKKTYLDVVQNSIVSDEDEVLGSGAVFNITRVGAAYTFVEITNIGNDYKEGDQLTILGSVLGGTDSINDLRLTVTSTTVTGGLRGVSISGTATGSGAITSVAVTGLARAVASGLWNSDEWYHIAVTRRSTEYVAFRNGQLLATVHGAGGRLSCNGFNIGLASDNINYGFEGYIDEIRVCKEIKYYINFSVPSTTLLHDQSTVLLLHVDGNQGSSVFFDDTNETSRRMKQVVSSGNLGKSGLLREGWRMAMDRYQLSNTPLTVDLSSVKISGSDVETVYPSSIENMRNKIKDLTRNGNPNAPLDTENEFLPLWMVTQQSPRTAAEGYAKAVPLCYCKPGEGDFIIENIRNSRFDFSRIDYEIDRYIIDSTTGNSNDQYLKFSDYKYNV
jgi:hypothetical protein